MDLFGIKQFRKDKAELIHTLKSLQTSNINAALSNMTTLVFPTWQVFREIESYQLFDDVYSVVSRLATSAAKIELEAIDKATEEEVSPDNNFAKWVNSLTFEKREQMYTYLFLTGELFIYKDRLTLGPNKGRLQTYFLHPNFVSLILSTGFPKEIVGYRYQDTQITFNIPKEDVIFIKYFNPTTVLMNSWRGLSPIQALAKRLTRLNANMNASVSQMQNGGVPSIVYDKTPGIAADVSGQHKENFARFLKNSDNKGAPYFTGGEMGVLQLGLSLADMDALSMADVDFDKICNAYSISSTLFNNKKASTESNVKEMRKDMYTNAIIPQVMRVTDGLTFGTVDVFGDAYEVKACYDDVDELREDMKMKAEAWAALPAFIPNEMRMAMGEDVSTDPNADKMYIKSSYVALDDLNIDVQPIDNSSNDYTPNN